MAFGDKIDLIASNLRPHKKLDVAQHELEQGRDPFHQRAFLSPKHQLKMLALLDQAKIAYPENASLAWDMFVDEVDVYFHEANRAAGIESLRKRARKVGAAIGTVTPQTEALSGQWATFKTAFSDEDITKAWSLASSIINEPKAIAEAEAQLEQGTVAPLFLFIRQFSHKFFTALEETTGREVPLDRQSTLVNAIDSAIRKDKATGAAIV